MPVIAAPFLNSSIYLYATEQDAKDGKQTGGCGFIVGIPSTVRGWHLYAVTNTHVLDAGFHVVRLNTMDGKSSSIKTDPDAWTSLPDDDVAVMPLDLSRGGFRIGAIDVRIFLKQDSKTLEVGDDAVLIGRLITHDGRQRNRAIARFGSIAMMVDEDEPVRIGSNPDGSPKTQVAFLVDCRSLSGASGSAVLGYRLPLRGNTLEVGSSGPVMLGIDCAHLPFWTQARDHPHGNRVPDVWVESNSGIAVVIPAWRILDLLNLDHLTKARNLIDETGVDRRE